LSDEPLDADPSDPAADEFKMRLLRPILIIGIILGVLGLAVGISFVSQFNERIVTAKRSGQPWLTSQVFFGYLLEIGLPLCLIAGSIECLKRRARGRLILLIYAWVSIGLTGYQLGFAFWNIIRFPHPGIVSRITMFLHQDASRAAFPAVLIVLLLTRPIRQLFIRTNRAFAVIPTSPSEQPPSQ
jgi:hypothetical protein